VAGRGAEKGSGVAVDASGAAYITGETDSHDFPTTRGAFQTVSRAGATDAFVITLAPNRRRLSPRQSLQQSRTARSTSASRSRRRRSPRQSLHKRPRNRLGHRCAWGRHC
jgi:hypothetical protein